jgi:hypothetical protein
MDFEIGEKYRISEGNNNHVVTCIGITMEGDPIVQLLGSKKYWTVLPSTLDKYKPYHEPERLVMTEYYVRYKEDTLSAATFGRTRHFTYLEACAASNRSTSPVKGIIKATLILEDYSEEDEEE